MTRLRIASDLHLEFGPIALDPAGEDILVLAGDIGIYIDGLDWAIEAAARLGVPAVMIAGNHEFYRNHHHPAHTMTGTIQELQRRRSLRKSAHRASPELPAVQPLPGPQ